MSTVINLRTIFCNLVNDDKFLSTIIETNTFGKNGEKNSTNLLDNMVISYDTLSPFEQQSHSHFPHKIKSIVPKCYSRFGIRNTRENDNGIVINISFLNSLNMVLRPEIFNMTIDDQMLNLCLLEDSIKSLIKKNCQIDKEKNTVKAQNKNKILITSLIEGKITHDLIQCIVNIYEINLVVFDLTNNITYFYWCRGTVYPFLNLFKDIYFMTFIHGNYEPVVSSELMTREMINKVYVKILIDNEIKSYNDIKLSIHSIAYIKTWKINNGNYIKILEKYYNKQFDAKKEMNSLNRLLKSRKKM